MVRDDLQKSFRDIQDVSQFWDFMEVKMGDQIFQSESLQIKKGDCGLGDG